MNKIDTITNVLYKIYFLLQHHFGPVENDVALMKDELMTRQDVKDYLKISDSTYKRKVSQGELRPMKLPGGDRYFKSQLHDEYIESIRRGRI